MTGTLIDISAIIVGSLLGLSLGRWIPLRIKETLLQVVGLIVLILGIKMALTDANFMLVISSLIIGAIIGENLNLDNVIRNLSVQIARKFSHKNSSDFSEGFLTSTFLFCIGAMSIVGSITEGLTKDMSVLLTKSVLDGITALFLATTFGISVMFSAIPVLIYQGSLTFLAQYLQAFFTSETIALLTSTGGFLLLCLGLDLLEIKHIRTINLLPGIPVVFLLSILF